MKTFDYLHGYAMALDIHPEDNRDLFIEDDCEAMQTDIDAVSEDLREAIKEAAKNEASK